MSTPLVPFHNALYTALDAISGLTAYSFIPQSPSFPYVYIERKENRAQDTNRSQLRYNVRSKLLVVTNDDNINTLAGYVNDIEDALSGGLTVTGWSVVMYTLAPDVNVFPVQNYDGSQGHAAEVFHDFLMVSS